MPTLEELVVAARSGDQHAFAALIEAEGPSAYRLARAVLASSPDAEEAVQDALISEVLAHRVPMGWLEISGMPG